MRGESPRAGLWGLILLMIVAAGALAFRLPRLEQRVMHGDEANQAVKTGILLDTGVYAYDPVEHHGPTLYFLSLPLIWASGAKDAAHTTEFTLRLLPVLFGVGVILLLIPLRRTLGVVAAVSAAVLLAVSPAMVFYSRYYVQEMLLVCFAFGTIVAGWRFAQTGTLRWALAAGLFAGLTQATKETCIIAFAAMAAAAVVTILFARLRDGRVMAVKPLLKPGHLGAAALVAVVVSVLFYSSFFTHPRGVLDSVLTYTNYVHKADSSHLHDKPWYYYFQILSYSRKAPQPWWSEGLILGLGLLGMIAALVSRGRNEDGGRLDLARFLSFYTVLVAAVYCAIPYKTPWLLINFLQPLAVVAGFGVATLLRLVRFRVLQVLVGLALCAGATQLGFQAYRAAYEFDSDLRNPYVYAHTSSSLLKLVQRVEAIAAVSPEHEDMLIRIIAPNGDYWPLPWYLRRFPRVGYWTEIPDDADASIVIAPAKLRPEIAPHLKNQYQSELYALRPGVLLMLDIRSDLWEKFMVGRR